MQAVATRRASTLSYKWQAAIIVGLGLFLSVLDNTIVSVALPAMRQAFNTDFDTITWVVTAYFLAQAAVIPVTGYLSDRMGTKLVFVAAMAIFVLGSACCVLAASKEALIAARVLQGIGGGALWPTSFAIAYRAFPRAEWGRATSIIGVPVLLAPALGPVMGGYLTTAFDWRAIFTINLPLGLAAFILGARILRGRAADQSDDDAPAPRRFDIAGFVLAMVGFTALVYGLTQAGVHGWGDATADRALIGGAVVLLALVVVELRAHSPVVDVRLFRNPTFAKASLLLWLVIAAFYGSLFLIPFFFERVEGHSALTAGEILIGQGVAAALGIALGGELYNKVGPRWLVAAGAIAIAVSMLGFTDLAVNTSGFSLQGWLILRGLGLGLSTTPLQNLALSVVSHGDLARASSLVNVIRQVFGAAGVSGLAAYVTQRAVSHTTTLTASLQAHTPSGAASACLASGASGLAACIGRHAIVMGLNDGFFAVLVGCALAVILALFMGGDPTLERRAAAGPGALAGAFPHLSTRALAEAANRAQPLSFQAGQVIMRQEDAADRFYIVTSGEVSVSRQTDAGAVAELATLGPGQFFGEIGLLANRPRTATVTAVSAVQVLALDHNTFSEIVSRSPATAEHVEQVMWQRLAVMP